MGQGADGLGPESLTITCENAKIKAKFGLQWVLNLAASEHLRSV